MRSMKLHEKNHIDRITGIFPFNTDDLEKISRHVSFKDITQGTILLSEGEKAAQLYMIIKGCLRTYFIRENGAEITSQFFIENQFVASFESAMTGTPSRVYIGAVEDSTIGYITIKELERIINENASAREHFGRYVMARLIYYMNQHASFILDSPEKRYIKLVKENPALVSRLPQQYIASYLGITPVSLSRIRSRLKRINNC